MDVSKLIYFRIFNMRKQKILEIIKKNIMAIIPELSIEQITLDKQLKDLGANSIDRMDILLAITEEIGVVMPLSELVQVDNIEGLIDILATKSL